jgi:hypothetical protein
MVESSEVSDLREQDDSGNLRDAPHGLDSLDHRRHCPVWKQFRDLLLQAVKPILAVADGGKVLLNSIRIW